MKNQFPAYYQPDEQWLEELWGNATFVFDTNVLLNFYRYSDPTTNELFRIVESIKDRVYVPHQAGLEFQRSRLGVISEQTDTYKDTRNKCLALKESLSNTRRHPFVSPSTSEKVTVALNELEQELSKKLDIREKLIHSDPLHNRIAQLFEGCVGEPLKEQEKALHAEFDKRIESKIPPGYRDANKGSPKKYGDLYIWYQLLEFAQNSKKDIVLITDDAKDDWWEQHRGRTISPRVELVEEIASKAGVNFYMYQMPRFIEHAKNYLDSTVGLDTISEVQQIARDRSQSDLVVLIDGHFISESSISSKYKALRRLFSQWSAVGNLVDLYTDFLMLGDEISEYPELLPDELLRKISEAVTVTPEAVVAVQAIHSIELKVLEKQLKKSGLPKSFGQQAVLIKSMRGEFINILVTIRENINGPQSALNLRVKNWLHN